MKKRGKQEESVSLWTRSGYIKWLVVQVKNAILFPTLLLSQSTTKLNIFPSTKWDVLCQAK